MFSNEVAQLDMSMLLLRARIISPAKSSSRFECVDRDSIYTLTYPAAGAKSGHNTYHYYVITTG